MADLTTADEVLAMAVDLEEMGQTFYRSLAQGCGDRKVAALCVRLAEAEARHAAVFRTMRKRLPPGSRKRLLTDEQASRAHAMVKEFVVPKPDLVHEVGMGGQLSQALAMAIQMEQDSVRFYEGILRDVHPDESAAVDEIIEQEKAHLRSLKAQVL
jgi:rubrerythrin